MKKRQPLPPESPPVPAPPQLPQVERAFFDMLLGELGSGVQEAEQAMQKAKASSIAEALQKSARIRQTIAYAQALLRLEEDRTAQAQAEPAELPILLNLAAKRTRRAFLYAGTALRRASEEPPITINLPQESFLFLLEEMLLCCLRCAPQGKSLHLGLKKIGLKTLLSLRTEGPALLQAPLIPLLPQEPAPRENEDYGFALCQALAARLGYFFRWEADGAGVRMFLEINAEL